MTTFILIWMENVEMHWIVQAKDIVDAMRQFRAMTDFHGNVAVYSATKLCTAQV